MVRLVNRLLDSDGYQWKHDEAHEKKIDTNIVAFDFFDTIVHRDCDPETIFISVG